MWQSATAVLSCSRVRSLARCYATDHQGELVSGFGRSLAVFEWRLIIFNRELIEKNLRLDEKLSVTIFSRDAEVLHKIITRARLPRVDDMMKVYRDQVPNERQLAQLRAMGELGQGGSGAGWWMPKDQAKAARRPDDTNVTAGCTCGEAGIEEEDCPLHGVEQGRESVNKDPWPR